MTSAKRGRAARRPLRVVLDSNIVLSALLFRGGNAACLRPAWQRGELQPLASAETVKELIRVLAYPKFRLSEAEQHDLLADYLPYSDTVFVPQPPPAVPKCRDPYDLIFLHLALSGKADTLVTGDKDLLTLAGDFPIPVLPLMTFLTMLDSNKPHGR